MSRRSMVRRSHRPLVGLGSQVPIAKSSPMPRPTSCTAADPTAKVAVYGGLVQYFNLDDTLIRILFVVLAVLGAPVSFFTWP
jgi:hypothetical protein